MTGFNPAQYWEQTTQQHLDVAEKTREILYKDFAKMLEMCTLAIRNGKKIMFAGNGGSAADAQHLATELSIRYIKDRPAIAALALTTDTSALTAAGNDMGFDYIFSRQIDAIGQTGDVLIAISTSGNSPNIINAIHAAKEKNMAVVGFSGRDGGKMMTLCDIILIVPSDVTAHIQEMHILIGHMLCGALEQDLGLV